MQGSSELVSAPADDLVSVIIPAYNAEAWIGATLESALAQTYRNLEVIVVDDGSKDGTFAIVETFASRDRRVRIVRQSNQGLPSARNAAIAAAKGSLIAPLDADDLWHPEKLAKQVAVMKDAGSKIGLVYSWCSIIDETGRVTSRELRPRHEGDVHAALVVSNFVSSASIPLIRRSCLEEIGGYDMDLREGCEDLKLYLDIAERYEFRLVPEFLVGYRKSSGSMSQNSAKMKSSHAKLLAEVRERRPDLPRHLFRRARSEFCYWYGVSSLRNGRFREGVSLLAGVALNDPLFLLRPLFREAAVRAVRKLGRRVGGTQHFIGRPFLEVSPTDGKA